MYNINRSDIDRVVSYFSWLFEYDYVMSADFERENIIGISFYNSPIRRSFRVSIEYDENTSTGTIAEAIINAYLNRLD